LISGTPEPPPSTERKAQQTAKIPLPAPRGAARPRAAAGEGVVSKKYLASGSDLRIFRKPTEGPIRIFFDNVGLGNRKGTNAMIRSERFIAGIAIVSIIASLGYIALTLIG
jgi:hypothetical protein